MSLNEKLIMDNIIYNGDIPYYKGMPCFLDGKRLNSIPYIDGDGFYPLIIGVMVVCGGNTCVYYDECIPYNEETAHLLGTTDDWK